MKHAIEEVIFVVTIVQVRKSTPVCVATAGRAVFETPPVLGLETMLKMNDGTSSIFVINVHFDLTQSAETHIFDDKFLRFSVKKAVDQRLSPLGQFLIKVSRFASTPSVQSEVLFHPPCCRKLMNPCMSRAATSRLRQVKRVPLTIGNDKGKVCNHGANLPAYINIVCRPPFLTLSRVFLPPKKPQPNRLLQLFPMSRRRPLFLRLPPPRRIHRSLLLPRPCHGTSLLPAQLNSAVKISLLRKAILSLLSLQLYQPPRF